MPEQRPSVSPDGALSARQAEEQLRQRRRQTAAGVESLQHCAGRPALVCQSIQVSQGRVNSSHPAPCLASFVYCSFDKRHPWGSCLTWYHQCARCLGSTAAPPPAHTGADTADQARHPSKRVQGARCWWPQGGVQPEGVVKWGGPTMGWMGSSSCQLPGSSASVELG